MQNQDPQSTEVTVVDIKMPFSSMVVFMIKWTIASIPAVLILMLIFGLFSMFFGGMFTMMSGGTHHY